ncbi:MAG: hypothetical protein ACYCQI_10400 [Gammaproteobacteria bacterium]
MLERKLQYNTLDEQMDQEKRKVAIAERLQWLINNRRKLGDNKFNVLLALVTYAEDNWTKTAVATNKDRFTTFNTLFSETNLNKPDLDFLDLVIAEGNKITEIKSSLRDQVIDKAENERNDLLRSTRRTYDAAAAGIVGYFCFELSPLSSIAYTVMAISYYLARENLVEPGSKFVKPIVDTAAVPAYNKLVKPAIRAMGKAGSAGLILFSKCRDRQGDKDKVPALDIAKNPLMRKKSH